MTNIEKLREIAPELVKEYSEMSKDDLLEVCCGEVLDLFAATDRVSLFMEECTDMSKTNYTLDSLKTLIQKRREQDLNEWCWYLIDEEDSVILETVKKLGGIYDKEMQGINQE